MFDMHATFTIYEKMLKVYTYHSAIVYVLAIRVHDLNDQTARVHQMVPRLSD